MAEIEVFRGCVEEAQKWARKAASLFTADADHNGLTETKILQARVFRCRGMFYQSLELLKEVEALLPPHEPGQRLDLLMEKAVSLYLIGRFSEAENLLMSALDKVNRQNNPYLLPYILEGLGNIYYLQGNYTKAIYFFKKGMESAPEGFLPGYHTQDHLSLIYADWGELQQALELAQRNLARKKELGMVETLPSAYTHLATIQSDLGQFAEAEKNYQTAISLLKEFNGEFTYLALSYAFYGRCLWLQGKMVEAKANIEQALAIVEIKDSLCYSSCQTVGGLILYQAGETKKGKQVLLEAFRSLEKQGFTKALAYACQSLAALYFAEGNEHKFLYYAKKALTLSAQINYLQNFLTFYEVFTPILQAGIEHNIELSFVQRIIIRLGARAHSILTPLLSHTNPEVRKRICAPLAELRDKKGEEGLLLLSQDRDREVQKIAALFLRKAPPPSDRYYAVRRDSPLQLKTLGSLQIFLKGTEVPDPQWRTRKAKHLLAYLAHYGEAVSKEKIINDLWPDTHGKKHDALFHTTLYRLRQVLNFPQSVLYKGGLYQLEPGSYQSDQREFEKLIQTASHPGLPPEEAVPLLEQATALYRGDYLADLDYNWLLPFQERLRHLYTAAQIKLGRYYLEKNNYPQAIFHLRPLLDISDFSEEIHALLMTAYAGLGDLKAVRKQFQTMTTMFREELGLSPSPEIIDLYYQLVSKTK
jgi:DNA-binding SARP family transcriptional activator